ncbi:MAG: polysaccharide pyruvyl transferase family protein, partial [Oscillospiraceae bacterium]|nr:polysaccharide pyruvyl transferase family protein [Oscillospiraceae bacterium]
MKIGIVTFHFAQNYGALLQCFALKTYLQKLNSGEVNIINYCPEYHYAEYRQSNPAFDNFIDTRISAIDYTEDDDYDVIIYGSDTIWHPFKFKTFEGFDEAYFAKKFKSKKHISFSASSCLEPLKKSEEKQPKISELLRNFSSISVRESFLADFIAECVDIPVHHTCDPTFLLSAEEWSGYLSEPI